MRFILSSKSFVAVAGPVLNKSLEIEVGWDRHMGVSFGTSFKSRGDHPGLRCWVDIFRVFAELNLHDTRHWNYDKNRFYEPGEEPVFEGYPHE